MSTQDLPIGSFGEGASNNHNNIPSQSGRASETSGTVRLSKFCMDCGFRFLQDTHKFCGECGKKREFINNWGM